MHRLKRLSSHKHILFFIALVTILAMMIAPLSGCTAKPKTAPDTAGQPSEVASVVTEAMESQVPEGYDLKVQRIADNQMILRLRDPNLKESYPAFIPELENRHYALWVVNIGDHWTLQTSVQGDRYYAEYNKDTISLYDSQLVRTHLYYNFETYAQPSSERRVELGMPTPQLYVDGQDLIYVLSIPDEVSVGFVEDYTYSVYMENMDGQSTSFTLTEEQARTTQNLLPDTIVAQKDEAALTIMPLSSNVALFIIDEADARKNVKMTGGQSEGYRMDIALGALSFTINGRFQSDGSIAEPIIWNINNPTLLPAATIQGHKLIIPVFLEPGVDAFDFLGMQDSLVVCDSRIDPPASQPDAYEPLYQNRKTTAYSAICDRSLLGMTLNEAYGILTQNPGYAEELVSGDRSGRVSLYLSGLTQDQMDALYYTPGSVDVLEYKAQYIDRDLLDDKDDPDAGIVYYMAWFDEQGNTLGYVEKIIFDTSFHPGKIVYYSLDNPSNGGMFRYTAVSLGYGDEEKPYRIVYRFADSGGSNYGYMLHRLGIETKEGFIRCFGHLEQADPPYNAIEQTDYKNIMDAKNDSAPYFVVYPKDDVFFTPTTDDFVLVEDYGLEQADTLDPAQIRSFYGTDTIGYDIARLRSFDESGEVVSEVTRYVFEYSLDYYYDRWYYQDHYQSDARDCFLALYNNREQYDLLVQVDNVVYFSQKPEARSDNRTKQELLDDFDAQGYKYYASKPLADTGADSAPISTGKIAAYDYAQDFNLELDAHNSHSATITFTCPFIKQGYTANRPETVEGTLEYQWGLSFEKQSGDTISVLGYISTEWYNEYTQDQTQPRNATITASDMRTQFHTTQDWQPYDSASGYITCETIDTSMIWKIDLPPDVAIDFTQIDAQAIGLTFLSPYETYYRYFRFYS